MQKFTLGFCCLLLGGALAFGDEDSRFPERKQRIAIRPMAQVFLTKSPPPCLLFSSERFFLCPFQNTPSEREALASILMSPEQMRYFIYGKPYTRPQVEASAQKWAKQSMQENADSMNWSIMTRTGVAGFIMIFNLNKKDGDSVKLAYCMTPPFAGKGLTSAASRLLIQELNTPVEATVHPCNIPSFTILLNLGFKQTHSNVPLYGSVRNCYFYTPPNEEAMALKGLKKYKKAFPY